MPYRNNERGLHASTPLLQTLHRPLTHFATNTLQWYERRATPLTHTHTHTHTQFHTYSIVRRKVHLAPPRAWLSPPVARRPCRKTKMPQVVAAVFSPDSKRRRYPRVSTPVHLRSRQGAPSPRQAQARRHTSMLRATLLLLLKQPAAGWCQPAHRPLPPLHPQHRKPRLRCVLCQRRRKKRPFPVCSGRSEALSNWRLLRWR